PDALRCPLLTQSGSRALHFAVTHNAAHAVVGYGPPAELEGQVRTRRRKTARPKPNSGPIPARRGHAYAADTEEQLKRQARELEGAGEGRAAMGEVLRVMSTARGKVHRVLDAVAENAARLCEANNAVIFRLEDNHLRHAASYGGIPTTS